MRAYVFIVHVCDSSEVVGPAADHPSVIAPVLLAIVAVAWRGECSEECSARV